MTTRGTASPQGTSERLRVPYWFTAEARRRHEDLRIGSSVRVRGLTGRKFELMEIDFRYGWVRVREVDGIELGMPWHHLAPWKKEIIRSEIVTQAIGDWLFGKNPVFRLSEPDRILKQKKIHWDRQTCDVEDEDGTVHHDVSWDDLEFCDDVDYHLPDDE